MNHMPAWLGIAGAVVGIVIFLGSVVVYFQGSKDQGTIRTLERSNQALTERVGLLEKENANRRTNEATLEARVDSLERENAGLLAQRPSAEVIAEIRAELIGFIADARHHNAEERALLMAIIATIEEQNDADH